MARALNPPPWLIAALLLLAFLAIYIRTAAPGLLSGDSAEFQLAAVTLGVAHPTTYPLYTLLGHLAVRLVPFGEPAWRVTLISAACAALAVSLQFLLALRLGTSRRAAVLAAALFGVTPGLWNAATLAEVYALLALLIGAAGLCALALRNERKPAIAVRQELIGGLPQLAALPQRRIFVLALVTGLGFTHHGLFAITVLPVCGAWVVWRAMRHGIDAKAGSSQPAARPRSDVLGKALPGLLGFLAGMAPWLYPCVQYARFGPFSGEDYGLPRHYYWGAPASWGAVFDLLTGGTVRRGIFRIPSAEQVMATCSMLGQRALFEYGWIGLVFAICGCVALWQRSRGAWAAAAWVILATSGYLLLLGPAVADAPIFTLPMLIPFGLWVAFGIDSLLLALARVSRAANHPGLPVASAIWRSRWPMLWSALMLVVLVAWLGWWADTRVEYASKRHLNLYRSFGESVIHDLPPNAVVLAHWEQGMVLQYVHLVEGQRPDVWIDVVEPSDDDWGARVARRYRGREVFLIGQAPDVSTLPVELVREDPYALVFRLRAPAGYIIP